MFFLCFVHFAVYLLRHDAERSTADPLVKSAMKALQDYQSSGGGPLSSDPQLVALFALPFASNPRQHPALAHIFHPSCVAVSCVPL